MRPIKFRAWDRFKQKYWFDIQRQRIERDMYLDLMDPGFEYTLSDDDLVVEQYTGLKDKNGVGIYEGDIVQVNYEKVAYNTGGFRDHFTFIGVVKYQNAGFYIDSDRKLLIDDLLNKDRYETYYQVQFTVIGNVYENAKLLEADE